MNPLLQTDSYKLTHPDQYPKNTQIVYSNITARKSRDPSINEVVVFGLQYFLKEYLIKDFNDNFFNRDKEEVVGELERFLTRYLGEGVTDIQKYRDLHDLGYLPLKIKALPEGTKCPVGVPYCTIVNTDKRFYWLTNFIETLMQNTLWNPLTAATVANKCKGLLNDWANKTCDNNDHVKFQAHNFSMRGMSSLESALTTDAGHLLSFVGSDTVPGIGFLEKYYNVNMFEELISCSVPASEHSVVCVGQKQDERETFRRLIQDVYPSGIVSLVADTWNLWDVLTKIAPSLKKEIEARDGKVVFRPDSGDPIKIVCGYITTKSNYTFEEIQKFIKNPTNESSDCTWKKEIEIIHTKDNRYIKTINGVEISEYEAKGCIQLLDEQFGSTLNNKGYKVLNPKVGLIYGDSINFEKAFEICKQLADKGYASSNITYGIGSFFYQYRTRDTFSIACKATYVEVDGKPYNIFKDPITDNGTKKSACGLLKVERFEGSHGSVLVLRDQVSKEEEAQGLLETVFEDGKLIKETSLKEIRKRLNGNS